MWVPGPLIDNFERWGTTVQFENTFMIIGGADGSTELNTLWYFDEVNVAFVKKKQTLKLARSRAGAALLPLAMADKIAC